MPAPKKTTAKKRDTDELLAYGIGAALLVGWLWNVTENAKPPKPVHGVTPPSVGGVVLPVDLGTVLTYAIATVVACGVAWLAWRLWRRHANRASEHRATLVAHATAALKAQDGEVTLKVAAVVVGRVTAGKFGYPGWVQDSDPKVRARFESAVRAKTGPGVGFAWDEPANEVAFGSGLTDGGGMVAASIEGDAPAVPSSTAEARLAKSLATCLATREKDRAECITTVAEWDTDHPMRIEVQSPASAAVKIIEEQGDIVDAVSAVYLPRGEWHLDVNRKSGRIVITDRPDPLAPQVTLPAVAASVDLEVGPVIGIYEDGSPWREPVIGKSTLLAGESGAGKGSIQWGILRGIVPMINDGLVKLWIWNPKMMEFGGLENVAYRYSDNAEESHDMFVDAVDELRACQAVFKASRTRKLTAPTKQTPAHFLLIDEIADLIAYGADAATLKDNDKNLRILVTQCRAAGWGLLAGLQDPRADTVKMRPLFTRTIAMRLAAKNQPDMVLGEGMRAQGALCDRIRPDRQGTAFVVDYEGQKHPRRVRAAFTTDAEVDRIISDLSSGGRVPAAAPVSDEVVVTATVVPAPRPARKAPARKPPSRTVSVDELCAAAQDGAPLTVVWEGVPARVTEVCPVESDPDLAELTMEDDTGAMLVACVHVGDRLDLE